MNSGKLLRWSWKSCLCLALFGQSFAQVNVQTGSAVFSLPIFSFSDNVSRVSLPISIGYNSGNGFRVDDIATDIGQGWGLIAGGKITRQQNGEPDDQVAFAGVAANGQSALYDRRRYPNGYLYASNNPAQGVPKYAAEYPVFRTQNVLYKPHNHFAEDRELDFFHLNLNGVNATFVLRRGSSEGQFLGQTLMKVYFETVNDSRQALDAATGITGSNAFARTSITAFRVVDENGIEYRFERKTYSRLMKTVPTDRSFHNQINPPKKYRRNRMYFEANVPVNDTEAMNPYIVTEWHLTSVRDLLLLDTGAPESARRRIVFNYTYRTIDLRMGVDVQYIDNQRQSSGRDYGKMIGRRSVETVPVISNITFPNGYQCSFVYRSVDRFDLPGARALSHIDVTYRGRALHRHQLQHNYVILSRYGTPKTAMDQISCRLYLTGVTKFTPDLADVERPYVFDYNLGGANNRQFVPPPMYIGKDVWGFANNMVTVVTGSTTVSAKWKEQSLRIGKLVTKALWTATGGHEDIDVELCKRLTFKGDQTGGVVDGAAAIGLLKSIQYPTGGSLHYTYQQNKARYGGVGAEVSVGGVSVAQTLTHDGGYNNNCEATGIRTGYVYKDEDGASSLWGVEQPLTSFTAWSDYRPFDRRLRYKPLVDVFPKCTFRFTYPGLQQPEFSVQLTAFQKIMSSRAVTISSDLMAAVGNTVTVLQLIGKIAGANGWTVIGAIIQVVLDLYSAAVTCFAGDDWKVSQVETHVGSNLRLANPLPMLYKRVEISQGTGNGKVIQEFTSDEDYALWLPSVPLFSKAQRFAPWAYGLLKHELVLNASGAKVKETINRYNFDDDCSISAIPPDAGGTGTPAAAASIPACQNRYLLPGSANAHLFTKRARAQKQPVWEGYASWNPTQPSDFASGNTEGMDVHIYYLYTGRTQLDSSIERVYDNVNTASYSEKITCFGYDERNFQVKWREEIAWSGIRTLQLFNYATQPALGYDEHSIALNRLLASNIYTALLSTETRVRKADQPLTISPGDASAYLPVSREEHFYKRIPITLGGIVESNAMVKLDHTELKRSERPIAEASFMQIPSVTTAVFEYDNTGTLTKTVDEGQRFVSQLYDHDKQFVVSTLVNGDFDAKAAYSSFETSNDFGNWSSAGNQVGGVAITGTKYLSLTNGQFVETGGVVPSGASLILSFWATSSQISITGATGATLTKNGPTRRGYTFYEYRLTSNGQKVRLTAGGVNQLDELRLYPVTSRMSTVAYDPLLGKISECDVNNRVTYYEYDSKARLSVVKDDAGDIVKMYEYNDKEQMSRCPQLYYSNAIYGLVQRNNCTGATLGSWVEYIIPAGAYSSTISQSHADWLAEQAYDAAAQGFANSNGTCRTIYYNTAKSAVFEKEGCDEENGYIGSLYTYTVPAGKYFSLVSQQDADDQADEEIDAEGQAAADLYGYCYRPAGEPVYTEVEGSMRCQVDFNGQTTGKTEVQFEDKNPLSSTFGSRIWVELADNLLGCTIGGGTCEPPAYKVVNYVCELGSIIYIDCYFDSNLQMMVCETHYLFSDGSVQIGYSYQ